MIKSHKLPRHLQEQIRQKANYLCEYCQTNERWQYVRFTFDHVLPLSKGGTNDIENFALACFHCNRRKSNNISAVDPVTGKEVQIFNPRTQRWSEHFEWSEDGSQVIGQTAVGRATIELLQFNRMRIQRIRRADVEAGRHPPIIP